MKKYEVYRNIRKGAVIFGLPLPLFALMMAAVLGSLLIVIFSFSFGIVLGAIVFNLLLYFGLLNRSKASRVFQFYSPFPRRISNKKPTLFNYDKV